MNSATQHKWPLVAVPGVVAFALLGMIVTVLLHAQVRTSLELQVLIGMSVLASIAGAIGGLLLASARRNVMWILAVALAVTALMALLATVIQAFARYA